MNQEAARCPRCGVIMAPRTHRCSAPLPTDAPPLLPSTPEDGRRVHTPDRPTPFTRTPGGRR